MKQDSRNGDELVKLQIPVDAALAETIDDLAHRLGRSRSWMVAELLQVIVEQRQRFGEWCVWRLMHAGIVKPIKGVGRLFGGRKPRTVGQEVVYLQTYVSPDLAQTITQWAKPMNEPESKMAALLLQCAVEDHGWLIEMVTSRVVTSLTGKTYHAGKPRGRKEGRDDA